MNAATSFWAPCLRDGKITDKEYSDAIASDIKLNVKPKPQGCSWQAIRRSSAAT